MDNRFTFISLFARSDYLLFYKDNIHSEIKVLFQLWKSLGFQMEKWTKAFNQNNYIFFYKSRFFSQKLSHDNAYEYILVPNLKNPRWLILNNKNVILNHGAIIKPTSLKARIIWNIAKIFNLFNLFTLVFPYRMIVSGDSSLGSCFYKANDVDLNATILYTGAPGRYQKFTIQYSDNNYQPVSYLKISNSTAGIRRIKNEEHALKKLNSLPFQLVKAPKLLGVVNKYQFYGFIQNNILNNENITPLFLNIDKLAINELYTQFPYKELKLSEYLLTINFDNISIDVFPWLRSYLIPFDNDVIVLTASHGDYIPWNRFISENTVKIIDWETFNHRPIFYDVCYFIIHKSILIENVSSVKAVDEILACMNEMLSEQEDSLDIDINFYLLLILVEIFLHYQKNKADIDHIFLTHLSSSMNYLYNEKLNKQRQ